jgi:hypothetical protein
VWADAIWGYQHRDEDRATPPTPAAWLWWAFATCYPDEVEEFLAENGWL